MPPVSDRLLILYLTPTEKTMRCVLKQYDESKRKERTIYYLSKKFINCESRYIMVNKLYCALVWAIKQL
ncbi:hypothetical protein Peur_011575 [Populus x canadensis]